MGCGAMRYSVLAERDDRNLPLHMYTDGNTIVGSPKFGTPGVTVRNIVGPNDRALRRYGSLSVIQKKAPSPRRSPRSQELADSLRAPPPIRSRKSSFSVSAPCDPALIDSHRAPTPPHVATAKSYYPIHVSAECPPRRNDSDAGQVSKRKKDDDVTGQPIEQVCSEESSYDVQRMIGQQVTEGIGEPIELPSEEDSKQTKSNPRGTERIEDGDVVGDAPTPGYSPDRRRSLDELEPVAWHAGHESSKEVSELVFTEEKARTTKGTVQDLWRRKEEEDNKEPSEEPLVLPPKYHIPTFNERYGITERETVARCNRDGYIFSSPKIFAKRSKVLHKIDPDR